MQVVETKAALREACEAARVRGARVGFVPTMGALHEGHARLLDEARARAEFVVCSIFVNPTQFGAGEDLDRYPRDRAGDLALCEARGVSLVFYPASPAEMYGPGHQVQIQVPALSAPFCGATRPGHFEGVATVVTKLFSLVRPHLACFGEKDFQQLAVIRRLSEDLDLGVEIVGVPTARAPDGLALSSRNAYLSPEARARALALWEGLQAGRGAYQGGERRPEPLRAAVEAQVAAGADAIDYVGLCDPATLADYPPDAEVPPEARVLIAAFFDGPAGGRTRLIDNGAIGAPPEARHGS